MELHFSPGAYYCGEDKNKDPDSLGYRSQMINIKAQEKEEKEKARERFNSKDSEKEEAGKSLKEAVSEPDTDKAKRSGSVPPELPHHLGKQVLKGSAAKTLFGTAIAQGSSIKVDLSDSSDSVKSENDKAGGKRPPSEDPSVYDLTAIKNASKESLGFNPLEAENIKVSTEQKAVWDSAVKEGKDIRVKLGALAPDTKAKEEPAKGKPKLKDSPKAAVKNPANKGKNGGGASGGKCIATQTVDSTSGKTVSFASPSTPTDKFEITMSDIMERSGEWSNELKENKAAVSVTCVLILN